MKVRIYQLDRRRALCAERMPRSRISENVNPKNYDRVFVGELESSRTLEDVYRYFNNPKSERPDDMRRLSVGDVIELAEPCRRTSTGFYLYNGLGFEHIDFDASLAVIKDFKMPRRYFKIIEIDHDSFVDSIGCDLILTQFAVPMDGAVYVSLGNFKEEISVGLYMFDGLEKGRKK